MKGFVPLTTIRRLLKWTEQQDLSSCRMGKCAMTDGSDIWMTWPLNDGAQAHFDYYDGSRPEEKRVGEFMRKLDRIVKRYAREWREELFEEKSGRRYWDYPVP
jgi:hypothetical protein